MDFWKTAFLLVLAAAPLLAGTVVRRSPQFFSSPGFGGPENFNSGFSGAGANSFAGSGFSGGRGLGFGGPGFGGPGNFNSGFSGAGANSFAGTGFSGGRGPGFGANFGAAQAGSLAVNTPIGGFSGSLGNAFSFGNFR